MQTEFALATVSDATEAGQEHDGRESSLLTDSRRRSAGAVSEPVIILEEPSISPHSPLPPSCFVPSDTRNSAYRPSTPTKEQAK
jgi:hypothetical protein